MASPRLLIAGGGTGGHLFPAMAVAEAWEKEYRGEVLFVGTAQGLEARILPEQGKALALLPMGQWKGKGAIARLATLVSLPRALVQAILLVRKFRPAVVLGVGGYASAPAVIAAWLLGIPVALHEQNAHPGLTNRWLGRLAQMVFISFPESAADFGGVACAITGNPVRESLLRAAGAGNTPPQDGPFRLLVFGGSQGASVFGRVVPEAMGLLAAAGVTMQLHQQARAEEVEGLQAFYQQRQLTAVVTPFIDDMGAAYQQAHLVISRAGATTVAELAIMGKAALLVPFPFAADDHQTANAQALMAKGGGWMIQQEAFTPQWLVEFLQERVANRHQLIETGACAHTLAKPAAAQSMAAHLRQLAAKE